jgi:DNA-binding NtrC family response regulator
MDAAVPRDDTGSKRILRIAVVDDDEVVRAAVTAMLQDMGAIVFDFASAAQALAVIAETPDIDLAVTDVNMPHMDGVAFAQSLAALRPGLPVIFMSGQARPPGACWFIAKPFGLDALADLVGAATQAEAATAAALEAPPEAEPAA